MQMTENYVYDAFMSFLTVKKTMFTLCKLLDF